MPMSPLTTRTIDELKILVAGHPNPAVVADALGEIQRRASIADDLITRAMNTDARTIRDVMIDAIEQYEHDTGLLAPGDAIDVATYVFTRRVLA